MPTGRAWRRGRAVAVRTDSEARGRVFPSDGWRPDQAGNWPPIAFPHQSGGSRRRAATFITRHLASQGYVIGALDHSEVVAPEIADKLDEIASRLTYVEYLIYLYWESGSTVQCTP